METRGLKKKTSKMLPHVIREIAEATKTAGGEPNIEPSTQTEKHKHIFLKK